MVEERAALLLNRRPYDTALEKVRTKAVVLIFTEVLKERQVDQSAAYRDPAFYCGAAFAKTENSRLVPQSLGCRSTGCLHC